MPIASRVLIGLAILGAGCGYNARPRPVEMVLAPLPPAAPASATFAAPRRARGADESVNGLLGVFVGEPIDAAIAKIGGETKINDLETERREWVELGYEPDDELPFTVGFDEAVTFDQPELPVYMLFGKDGWVALIRFSAYVATPDRAKRAAIGNGCGLLSPPPCIERAFGEGFLRELVPAHDREVHHYLSSGVSVTVEADAIRVIDVYGPLGPEAIDRVKRGLANKARHPSAP